MLHFCLFLLTVLGLGVGSPLAGIGTDEWLHGRIQRADAVVTGWRQRPVAGAVGVECVVRLSFEDVVDTVLTIGGPCGAPTTVRVCYGRTDPLNVALVDGGGKGSCPDEHDAVLRTMIAGWACIGMSVVCALTLTVMLSFKRISKQEEDSLECTELAQAKLDRNDSAMARVV